MIYTLVLLIIYLSVGTSVLILIFKKMDVHFELLCSIDSRIKRFSSLEKLAKSPLESDKFLALSVMLPIFYIKPDSALVAQQIALKNKVNRLAAFICVGALIEISLFFVM